jgi:beta-glucosidase
MKRMTQMPQTDVAGTYRDTSLPTDERVEQLIGLMTLQEKVAQLSGRFPFEFLGDGGFDSSLAADAFGRDGLGHLSGASVGVDDLTYIATFLNDLQRHLVEHTRLGIPAICHNEALSGLMLAQATSFPSPNALAATWNPGLIEAMTSTVRRQMRAVGIHQALAPVLDVARDARWGRTSETYGEDPYLCSEMGVAFVRGLQGSDLREGVVATAKHFLGYGLSQGGCNLGPVQLSAQELYEVYARPFEAAIREAHMASVMSAYTEVNGSPCSGAPNILSHLLRDRLGFEGFVVADYGAIGQLFSLHGVAGSPSAAGIMALKAGLDVELPVTALYGEQLATDIGEGQIDEAVLDTSVRRVLQAKFQLGLFENPYAELTQLSHVFGDPSPNELAYQLALESLTLLENDGILPLPLTVRSIAVIGPNANSVRNLFSGYTPAAGVEMRHAILEGSNTTMAGILGGDASLFDGPGSGGSPGEHGEPNAALGVFTTVTSTTPVAALEEVCDIYPNTPTLLDSVRAIVEPGTEVFYDEGCEINGPVESIEDATEVARKADVAIIVLGDKTGWAYDAPSGESRDRSTLELPGHQVRLLQEVCKTGTPVIVVLVNGRPMPLPPTEPKVRAVLEAWQPGATGGRAVASVLFGAATPGGKLPITIPRSAGQCPIFYGRKPGGSYSDSATSVGHNYTNESGRPAYPFGHGLSYTHFRYHGLEIHPQKLSADDSIRISLSIGNEGQYPGDEVVQLYIRLRSTSITRPLQELAGFHRLFLAPGQERRVTFDMKAAQLACLNAQGEFVVEPGEIVVMLGSSSADIRVTGNFHLMGPVLRLSHRQHFSSLALSDDA